MIRLREAAALRIAREAFQIMTHDYWYSNLSSRTPDEEH